MARVQSQLCQLTNAERVAILLGSGTLANDVIGGQIWQSGQRGVVIVDGEFGRRLADHASRWSLPFDVFERDWGQPWHLEELGDFLAARPDTQWLWLTLCETSTGVLRDINGLRHLASAQKIELYLDAVSAIGAVPVDLSGVRMASAVSGKALGSFPGLAMVLQNPPHRDLIPAVHKGPLPRYMDLALYNEGAGVPFTQSSHLIWALQVSLGRYASDQVFSRVATASLRLRDQLKGLSLELLGERQATNPAVMTIALPAGLNSRTVGDELMRRGIRLSYESDYLLRRNWIQICLMGDFDPTHLPRLAKELAAAVGRDKKTPATRHRLAAGVSGRTRQ
jgi:aspartate aminotransferase-like enzyme